MVKNMKKILASIICISMLIPALSDFAYADESAQASIQAGQSESCGHVFEDGECIICHAAEQAEPEGNSKKEQEKESKEDPEGKSENIPEKKTENESDNKSEEAPKNESEEATSTNLKSEQESESAQNNIEEADHKLSYVSNDDGTHNIICSVEDCEENHNQPNIPCEFEDGKCTLCNYEIEAAAYEINRTIEFSDDDIAHGTYEDITWVIDKDGTLFVEGTGEFAPTSSNNYKRAPWWSDKDSIKKAVIRVADITDTSYMFSDCSKITEFDFSDFDTSSITNMRSMFDGCKALRSLDLSSFDTQMVKDMSSMFDGCSLIDNLDISSFNTSNVETMMYMFRDCRYLENIYLNGLDTTKVGDISGMFRGCRLLSTLDLSSFNLLNVNSAGSVFYQCVSLREIKTPASSNINIYLPNIFCDDSGNEYEAIPSALTGSIELKVKDDAIVFSDDDQAHGVYEGTWWVITKDGALRIEGVGPFKRYLAKPPWYGLGYHIRTAEIRLEGCDDFSYMFCDRDLYSVDWSACDFYALTDTRYMFQHSRITKDVISGLDTRNVIYMDYMFSRCVMTDIDELNFDTHNAENMDFMFMWAENNSGSLNLSSFDTSCAFSMQNMFTGSKFKSIDMSNFSFSDPVNVQSLLSSCKSLTSLITPANVKVEIALPVTLYDKNNNAYDSIPLNLESLCLHLHEFGDTVRLEDPTCSTEGKLGKICNICQYEEAEGAIPVDANTHISVSAYLSDTEKHWQVCEGCGQTINQNEHSYSPDYQNNAENHWQTCEICDAKHNVSEHVYGDYYDIIPATHLTDGSRKKSCETCGYTINEIIPKIAEHSYTGEWQKDETSHWKTCECGDINKSAHDFGSWVISLFATHLAPGAETRTCLDCGYSETRPIAQITEHSFTGEWQKDETSHWKTCECGETNRSVHDFNEWEIVTEATHLTEGLKKHTCATCGYEASEAIPKATIHVFNDVWEKDATGHCQVCACGEKTAKSGHTYGEWQIVSEPAITANGLKKKVCTDCGYEVQESIPASGVSQIAIKEVSSTGAPDSSLQTLTNEAKENIIGSLTTEERAAVNSGKAIDVYTRINSATFSISESSAIEAAAGSNSTVCIYLDISMYKKVEGCAEAEIEPNAPVTVTFKLPDEFKNLDRTKKRTFKIIHLKKDGSIETLIVYYNEINNTITFTTTSFSSFALAYEDTPVSSGRPANNSTEKTINDYIENNNSSYLDAVKIVVTPVLPYGTVTGMSAGTGGDIAGDMKTLNATQRDTSNHHIFANYYASRMNLKAQLLDTKEIYAPISASSAWKVTPRIITWKNTGVKYGDLVYVTWYCEEAHDMQFIPAIVLPDGTIQFAVPRTGSMSIVGIVKLTR